MKQFIAFVKKEFYHILRDPRSVLILLGMPIAQIILFGFAVSTELKHVNLGVYDPSQSVESKALIDKIGSTNFFTIAERLDSPNDIESLMRKGKANCILVFDPDFGENFGKGIPSQIQIIVDASDPNQSTMIVNYLNSIFLQYQGAMVSGASNQIIILPEVKQLYNPQLKGAFNFVPGVMGLILLLICAMMTSISIVRERERGTMEVLLVSPIKPIWIIIAKLTPYVALSCINLCTILLLAVFVLEVPIAGSLTLLLAFSLLYILVALALGLLVSTLVTTQVAAMLISGMVMMMPVMLLSGMTFPIEGMPSPLRILTNIVPAKWYISGIKKVMIEGLSFNFITLEFSVLLGMFALFLMISIKRFKTRL